MGLATGWALKRRGLEPVVYEQFEVGNDRGSSHGRSRIFRLAYAEDDYVRLAQEALGLWRELEAETGEKVLELTGLVEIVQTMEESTAETLERCGVAWERLEREEAERRYPIRVPEGSFVVVQPEAGIARADNALAAFARGLDVREHTRAHPDEVDADVVVVDRRLVGQRAPRRAAAGDDDARDALLLPARRRSAGAVGRLVPARDAHARHVLAPRPDVRPEGRRAPRGAEGRSQRARRARAAPDRAHRCVGCRDLSAGRPDAGRRGDLHVHDHRRRVRSSSSAAAVSSSARPARATASSSRPAIGERLAALAVEAAA